jgi:hypothetical protein
MREIIHRVDAPGIAGTVMMRVFYAVHQRIAQQHIWRCQVDLSTQDFSPSSGYLPAFISANNCRFSSTLRLRYWFGVPGSVGVPFCAAISSALLSST